MYRKMTPLRNLTPVCVFLVSANLSAFADGVYRNGASARAMSLGGADVAIADEPLDAMHSNPAGLSLLKSPSAQAGFAGAIPAGEFSNSANSHGDLKTGFGAFPQGAFGLPLKSGPFALGVSVIPEALLDANWHYIDTPGGVDGNTSYGSQQHRSAILAVRSALGASYAFSDSLSVGASVGAIYNENTLQVPYVFQSHPVLKGFKTLLDLKTDGWGINGSFGGLYRPIESVSIGASYQLRTRLSTDGNASGNIGTQLQNVGLGGARPDFHYDAQVENALPGVASVGLAWQIYPKLRSVFQVDWVNWGDAFDQLHVHLTKGNNTDINGVLGTDTIDDYVPLNWKNRFVYRTGLEYGLTDAWILRAGYAYGQSPVPDSTLTPMTGVITEHTLTAGVGFHYGRYTIDLAYQYELPADRHVGTSALLSGEYSNSNTSVSIHWVGLTTGIHF
ncbi:MAG: Long-chain fatty acid transport protein [Verrucomicrobiales bacterium]|nr:Long-chain fatty acid transport protein [Verrucomicrobiales bacterium]